MNLNEFARATIFQELLLDPFARLCFFPDIHFAPDETELTCPAR